jgi:hypothetical protein
MIRVLSCTREKKWVFEYERTAVLTIRGSQATGHGGRRAHNCTGFGETSVNEWYDTRPVATKVGCGNED